MQNKYRQKRKEQWFAINSFRQNESYVIKIFNKFGFIENNFGEKMRNNTFKFTINNKGDYDVLVVNDIGKAYRIVINADEFCYKILEESLALNKTHKPKYHEIKIIQSDDAIIDLLRYMTGKDIKNDSIDN